jgi:RNA polymerase sigma-70 factor (ECF subfamily)
MPHDFEQFRHYLWALARAKVDPGKYHRVDVSGIVQETLLEAARDGSKVARQSTTAQAAWLRQILAHNLTDEMRALRSEKRDVARERSLDDVPAESSIRMGALLADRQPSPSSFAVREERAVRVADALSQLPDSQRDALLLHYWQGQSLTAIAAQMKRTPAAAAGLLKRGIARMRELLDATKE